MALDTNLSIIFAPLSKLLQRNIMTLLIFLIFFLAFGAGLYKLFEKAGQSGWKAMVPFYNLVVWADLIGMKRWRLVYMFVPLVNIFTFAYMLIDLVNSFGRWGFWQQAAAVAVPFIYLPMLGFAPGGRKEQVEEPVATVRKSSREKQQPTVSAAGTAVYYEGPARLVDKNKQLPKGVVREWAEAIIFAVFAAHFIRTFLIEAYVIPTPSMDASLRVGDFLFVSKIQYGARTPEYPLSFPLVHNVIPRLGTESYSMWPKLPKFRTPGFSAVNRYDPVVFNFPEGDTVFKTDFSNEYYSQMKMGVPRERLLASNDIVVRPLEKRDNYVKRCVAIAGDTVRIINSILYINGQKAPEFSNMQYKYRVFSTKMLNTDQLMREHEIEMYGIAPGQYIAFLSKAKMAVLKTYPGVDSISTRIDYTEAGQPDNPNAPFLGAFPGDATNFKWNVDNYGPLWIPKKGATVKLTPQNISLYKRVIVAYEGNTLELKGNSFIINGQPADSYTFKQDYYWMMGDNRHNSADSRSWGYVPADHIVGKPLFIWMSLRNNDPKQGIRTDRLFTGATKM